MAAELSCTQRLRMLQCQFPTRWRTAYFSTKKRVVNPTVSSVPDGSLKFETGRIANLANGAVLTRSKGSVVLCSAVTDRNSPDETGFLPLTVDYREKAHATGRIPQTRDRRDGAPTDDEVLCSRILDRVVRPLFPSGFVFETQLLATLYAQEEGGDPITTAVNAACAALCVSDMPWNGPVGCTRIGLINGKLVINPDMRELEEKGEMDLLYAGNEHCTLMLEMDGKQIQNRIIKTAIRWAHNAIQPIITAQENLAAEAGKPKSFDGIYAPSSEMAAYARTFGWERAVNAFSQEIDNKEERGKVEGACISDITKSLQEKFPDAQPWVIASAAERVMKDAMASCVAKLKKRGDGRGFGSIRPLHSEVEILPVVHGSALFTRGQTQSLSTVTFGPKLDRQPQRFLGASKTQMHRDKKKYGSGIYLQYDFPPFSVNEVGKVGGVNRRMIGHGNLARKAIVPVMPSCETFPYQTRITCETTMSNGSSSMASTCAASMALMDAGVPISSVVGGVSVGLLTGPDFGRDHQHIGPHGLIVDITGTEDHYGEMDFKIAGTNVGITAMQLDVKLAGGVPPSVLQRALLLASPRLHFIIQHIRRTINKPRDSLKSTAPRIHTVNFNLDRMKDIIGPGRATLKHIEEEYDALIDLSEEGQAHVFSFDPAEGNKAVHVLEEVTADIIPGKEYIGTVTCVLDYGAMVAVLRGKEGLLHVSQMDPEYYSSGKDLGDYLKVGQDVRVACTDYDDIRGTIRLSLKELIKKEQQQPSMSSVALPKSNHDGKSANQMHSALRKVVAASPGKGVACVDMNKKAKMMQMPKKTTKHLRRKKSNVDTATRGKLSSNNQSLDSSGATQEVLGESLTSTDGVTLQTRGVSDKYEDEKAFIHRTAQQEKLSSMLNLKKREQQPLQEDNKAEKVVSEGGDEGRENLNQLTVKKLRDLCTERGLKVKTSARKSEIIDFIISLNRKEI